MVLSVRNLLLLLGLGVLVAFCPRLAHAQIPPGFEVIRLTDDPDFDDRPAINNFGQVVWSKRIDQGFDTEEIFFFDGVEVRRITDDNIRDAFPDLNDFGTLVWSREKASGETENFEIAMWRDGRMTLLTDDEVGDWSPSVNNREHVAWSRDSGRGCTGAYLMFYDGSVVEQLTDDDLGSQIPEINSSDEIAWVAFDDCRNPWMSTIKMYSAGRVIELTKGDSQDNSPTINNASQVAWRNGYPDPQGIDLWESGNVTQITDSGRNPDLNCVGSVAFSRWNASRSIWEQWLFVGDEFLRISDPDVRSSRGAINDCGEVAWNFGEFPNFDITLMRLLPGDVNHDGVVTLSDAVGLAACLTGPLQSDQCAGPGVDWDRDGDVDLRDFALQQVRTTDLDQVVSLIECMMGPMDLDEFCACRALDFDHDRDVDLKDFASFQTLLHASP